jgi:N-acetylneuraminate lyase
MAIEWLHLIRVESYGFAVDLKGQRIGLEEKDMTERLRLKGLVAAVHTPFHADGALNVGAVEGQAAHLIRLGVGAVFVAGSTGESHSLAVEERLHLARRWVEVARGTPLRVVVHVGGNCLEDVRRLAAAAGDLEVSAIAALAPSYFKPRGVAGLVDWCVRVAGAAPATPFYFYDIPSMTHTAFAMSEFLERGTGRIASLHGIKFTNYDLLAYQVCLGMEGGRFDIPWGVDEFLLAALAVGAQGAVGSSYNFAAPIYQRLIAAFERGDLATARAEQYRSVQLIRLLAEFDYMGAAKAVMGMLGVDVGPARPPNPNPTPEQLSLLRNRLEQMGFFDWIRMP